MPVRFVLADDLTGACDAGVQLVQAGCPVRVFLDGASREQLESGAVASVDFDSRAAASHTAFARIATFVRGLGPVVPSALFKKVDSTLRGPIGAEVAAMLDVLPGSVALVAPAYPANRRTTRGGIQLIEGIPVHESALARDPRTPVGTSRIADLFPFESALVSRDITRGDPAEAARIIARERARGVRCFVFDAIDDADMPAIVRACEGVQHAFWVGSAGILSALAPADAELPALPRVDGLSLIVIGSVNPASREQIADLRGCGIAHIEIDTLERVAHVREMLARDGIAVISTSSIVELARVDDALALVTRAAAALAPDLAALALTGGETARAVCGALGIAGFELEAEVLPGIAVSRVNDSGLRLVTKAGGFGGSGVWRSVFRGLGAPIPAFSAHAVTGSLT